MENLPEKIGGCRILAKLGQGGMGAVYRARHETLGREVAIKLLPQAFTQNSEYVQRFLREARAAAQLQHPNIVQVYDAGEQTGQYYIAMEFVDGVSLAHRLLNEGVLPEYEALNYLAQAARGLTAAHALGLIHRDIKPENLLINRENTLKIADFGLVTSSAGDSALTQAGAMMGTPLYMSPEQGEGHPADARSDLYSLGVTFFRALTGSTPFNAPSPIGIIYKHKYEPTPDPQTLKPGLSPASGQLLLKLMAKKPEERFQTADEVARTAEALLAQMQTGQVPAVLPVVAPGRVPASAAMPAVGDAYAPTMTPARGAPGVATPMPMPRHVSVATPPVAAQAYIPPPPPGQVYTPVPQPGQVYTPAPPPGQVYAQPGQMVAPVYQPTPGMPMAGVYTPAPVPPKRSSGVLIAMAAVALLFLVAVGGFFGYRFYRQGQVDDAKREASDFRANKQYDQAIKRLEAAYAQRPDAPDLKTLRDSIEATWVNERVTRLKDQAQRDLNEKNYEAAVKAYKDAEQLLADRGNLAGVDADPSLADRRKKAENLHQFTTLMDEGRVAEKGRQFDAAEKAFREAAKFEAKGSDEAAQAATRMQSKGLIAQAEALETSRNYPEALKLLDQAAALKVEDVSARRENLKKTMEYLRLTAEATKANETGDYRTAATLFEKAAQFAATPEEGNAALTRAKGLATEAEFITQSAAGQTAMAERRWQDAQAAWTAALKAKPGDEKGSAQLKRARSNQLADETAALIKQNDYQAAKAKLAAAQKEDPTNEAVNAMLQAVESRMASLKDLTEGARKAEAAGDWNGAFAKWKALTEQDPANKTTYEQHANNARFEQAMADCKTCLAQGNLQEALRHAKAAQPFDTTGGQRAQIQIQEIEGRLQAIAREREQAAAVQGALTQANTFAAQGQYTEAVAVLASAAQSNPGNVQLVQMKSGLEAVAAIQRGYSRLEGYRQDAESAIQNAYKADDDKKIAAMLGDVQAWQGRLAQGKAAPQAAWQAQRFEDLAGQAAAMKALAREMGQSFSNLAAIFDGKAASAAKPKANVGGMIGGIGGIGRRGAGFGGINVNADVGDDQKKAGIFSGTARSLERCAENCRAAAE